MVGEGAGLVALKEGSALPPDTCVANLLSYGKCCDMSLSNAGWKVSDAANDADAPYMSPYTCGPAGRR